MYSNSIANITESPLLINNKTSNDPLSEEGFEVLNIRGFGLLVLLLLLVMSVVTIVGNVLVIAGPLVTSQLWGSGNVYITLMAGFDLFTGLVVIPMLFVRNFILFSYKGAPDSDIFGQSEERCKIFLIANVSLFSSFTMLVLMTCDRSLAVNFPLFHRKHLSTKSHFPCIFILFYTIWIVFSIAYFYTFEERECTLFKGHNMPEWWTISFLEVTIIAYLTIAICLSTQIIYISVKIKRVQSSIMLNKTMVKDGKSGARMAAILTLMFTFLSIPTFAESVTGSNVPLWLQYLAEISRTINASINIFVYAGVREVNKKVYLYLLKHWPWHWKSVNKHLNRRFTTEYHINYFTQKTDPISKTQVSKIQSFDVTTKTHTDKEGSRQNVLGANE